MSQAVNEDFAWFVLRKGSSTQVQMLEKDQVKFTILITQKASKNVKTHEDRNFKIIQLTAKETQNHEDC